MWSIENSKHDEAAKIRWELVPYFHGRVLDIGLTRYKTFPHFIGIGHNRDVKLTDAADLSLFADRSCDAVFSAFTLDQVQYEDWPKLLTEWCRVIRQDGHLLLYLPDAEHYPKAGSGEGDPEHRCDVTYDKVVAAMDKVEMGWDLCEFQKRSETDEYALFFAFITSGGPMKQHKREFSWKNPRPTKTCGVVRLGAFGDVIQSSSILPWLREQGYHITFYCSDHGYPVIQHDPHIDRFVIQGAGEVPPQFLGEFWDYTEKKYDKWVNLSESVECTLLAAHDHSNFYWPNSVRAKYMDRNYIEFTHELAEVPPPYRPKFYSTLTEKAWARDKARSYGKRNILWSLSGSSVHKTWPHLDAILARIMLEYKDAHVILVGDEVSQILETGWEGERRVHCRSGKWSIRESMAFAEVCDLIIGTETGLMNSAGHMDAWKIVTLSHSSANMLTKHWKNVIVLEQPKGIGCPKQPCRQLHVNWDHCMKHEETGSAVCQHEISIEMMWDAISSVLRREARKAA